MFGFEEIDQEALYRHCSANKMRRGFRQRSTFGLPRVTPQFDEHCEWNDAALQDEPKQLKDCERVFYHPVNILGMEGEIFVGLNWDYKNGKKAVYTDPVVVLELEGAMSQNHSYFFNELSCYAEEHDWSREDLDSIEESLTTVSCILPEYWKDIPENILSMLFLGYRTENFWDENGEECFETEAYPVLLNYGWCGVVLNEKKGKVIATRADDKTFEFSI